MASRDRIRAQARHTQRMQAGQIRASLRDATFSARKAQVLAGLIRGLSVEDAILKLNFQRRRAALPMRQLLDSAVANAHERGMDVDRLVVGTLLVHKGPIRPRFMPRAHGRASKIRKQTSHIEVSLVEVK